MRVAVLGAGFQGTCVALELAQRGIMVDLYDQNDTCITQAGYRNEGKIHLGFVYAKDPTFATASLMARGALAFGDAIRRWLALDINQIGASSAHHYAFHRDSIVPRDDLLAHFAKVEKFVRELGVATGANYLGQDVSRFAVRRRSAKLDDVYDPTTIISAVETDERSVNVMRLAELMRQRVADESRVTFCAGLRVTRIERDAGAIAVSCAGTGLLTRKRYQKVVNCLWDGKLIIDRQMGILPPHPWLYRLKYGINIFLKKPDTATPSVTIMCGSFGDVVRLNDRHMYLSWYPTCLASLSRDIAPPEGTRELSGDAARRLVNDTVEALGCSVVSLRGFREDDIAKTIAAAGIILAAGETDINDPDSGLHQRTHVGIQSAADYHSINTGKYTLAPMFAIEAANRVCGTH